MGAGAARVAGRRRLGWRCPRSPQRNRIAGEADRSGRARRDRRRQMGHRRGQRPAPLSRGTCAGPRQPKGPGPFADPLESLRSKRRMQENAARAVPGASEADSYAGPAPETSSPDSADPSPLTAPQLVRLAASRRAQGDLRGAFEAYTRATAADPQLADELREEIETLRSELARRAYAKGLLASRSDLDAAITLFEEALEFDPEHAGALLGLKRARAARRVEAQPKNLPRHRGRYCGPWKRQRLRPAWARSSSGSILKAARHKELAASQSPALMARCASVCSRLTSRFRSPRVSSTLDGPSPLGSSCAARSKVFNTSSFSSTVLARARLLSPAQT